MKVAVFADANNGTYPSRISDYYTVNEAGTNEALCRAVNQAVEHKRLGHDFIVMDEYGRYIRQIIEEPKGFRFAPLA